LKLLNSIIEIKLAFVCASFLCHPLRDKCPPFVIFAKNDLISQKQVYFT